jgi:hypothetical protein
MFKTLNLKLKWEQKDNHEKTHTLNEHTWGRKTLWKNTTLARKHWLIKKKVKSSKSLELPP